MMQRETRGNCERYKQLRRNANRICRRKKREMIKKQFEEIEELNRASEARKLYAAMDKMRKAFQPREREGARINRE
jgi:hypothetical protein